MQKHHRKDRNWTILFNFAVQNADTTSK